jgi:transcriptional regulator with XRE-family HTH domain
MTHRVPDQAEGRRTVFESAGFVVHVNSFTVGRRLREIRSERKLTQRDVEAMSRRIADGRDHADYFISAGRLSQIENSNSLPSPHKIAALGTIYQVPFLEILRLYGVETDLDNYIAESSNVGGSKELDQTVAL